MVLHGELAVRALDFLLAALPLHPENFVIIAFAVTGQNGLPLSKTKQSLAKVMIWSFLLPVPSRAEADGL
jgi:BarA-like signal transduction histidine kinase